MAEILSLVIPTRNRRENLETTLKSLINQSHSDFEVIISDDGSSDGTGGFLQSRKWPFPLKYFWHEWRGRSFSRNFGVTKSSGPIILFLDDHIVLDRDCLKNHLQYHEKFRGTPYQVIRGRAINQTSLAAIPEKTLVQPVTFRQRLDEQNPWVTFFTCNTSLVKEAFLKVGGFDENFTEYGFEDNELGFRLRRAGYKFRINPAAVGYLFPYLTDRAGRVSKARQVGHMAVVFARKYPGKKYLVGVNIFNRLVYKIFETFPMILKRIESGLEKADASGDRKKQEFYEFWLRHYNFLAGMDEAGKK